MNHFGKFSQCMADMQWYCQSKAPMEVRHLALACASAINFGHRFYIPWVGSVLEGRLIDEDVKRLVRLPYEVIAVLSETEFDTYNENVKAAGWKITVAWETKSYFNKRMRLSDPDDHRRGFGCLSVSYCKDYDKGPNAPDWVVAPGAVFCNLPDDAAGYEVTSYALPMIKNAGVDLVREFSDDVFAVLTLCAMLGLHNVSRSERKPPEKLAKRRVERGGRSLFSYHVLRVDGQDWDAPEVTGRGLGVRSHLRRGHIRRLHGGDRMVWVRATYVHGNVPGFVGKDYDVH